MTTAWREWLLSAARQESPPAEAPDWARFSAQAGAHQTAAYFYWVYRASGQPAPMPTATWEALRFLYLHHHMRNIQLFRELAEIHETLSAAGLEHLFAKGPWLAFHAWPASGARPVGDIDLVVHERDVRAVWGQLCDLGYRAESVCPRDGREALAHAHYRRQYRFFAAGRRPLELHFRLVNLGPPSEGEPWLWRGRRLFPFSEGSLPVPDATAMLFHLLLHANQHGFAVLRLLLDIRFHLECAGGECDQALLAALIKGYRLRHTCYHALALTAAVTGYDAFGAVALDKPNWLQRRRFALLWSPQRAARLALPRTREPWEAPKLFLAEMATPRSAWRYLHGIARGAGGWSALLRRLPALAGAQGGSP